MRDSWVCLLFASFPGLDRPSGLRVMGGGSRWALGPQENWQVRAAVPFRAVGGIGGWCCRWWSMSSCCPPASDCGYCYCTISLVVRNDTGITPSWRTLSVFVRIDLCLCPGRHICLVVRLQGAWRWLTLLRSLAVAVAGC